MKNIKIGKILSIDQHPNADRLKVLGLPKTFDRILFKKDIEDLNIKL